MDESILNQIIGDHYRITERIKAGGVAVVYRAIDLRNNDDVAIKLLQSSWAEHDEVIHRFEREAKIMQTLQHPHIVRYRDHGRYKHRPFIVMDYIGGGSLSEQLKNTAEISLGNAVRLIAQVADALTYAHDLDIVHRDLKPGNILIEDDDTAKLTDFGIARVLEGTMLTMTGHMPGTPLYMSPEQARGEQDLGPLSDLYSLAVIAYLLCTGYLPFSGTDSIVIINQHLSAIPASPTELNPSLPPEMDDVLLKGLAKIPQDRYASVKAFSDALTAATGNYHLISIQLSKKRQSTPVKPVASPAKPIPQTTSMGEIPQPASEPSTQSIPSNQNRNSRIFPIAIVILLLLIAILVFFIQNDDGAGTDNANGNGGAVALAEATPEVTESPTPTATDTDLPTNTRTITATATATSTLTETPTSTITVTSSSTSSVTPTHTPTLTTTTTVMPQIGDVLDLTLTEVVLLNRALTALARTPSATPNATMTPTSTPTITPTVTLSPSPTLDDESQTETSEAGSTSVAELAENMTATQPGRCLIRLAPNVETVLIHVGPGLDRSPRGNLANYLQSRSIPAAPINGQLVNDDGELWWRIAPSGGGIAENELDRFWLQDTDAIVKIGDCEGVPVVDEPVRINITPTLFRPTPGRNVEPFSVPDENSDPRGQATPTIGIQG